MFWGLILVVNHIVDYLLGCNAKHFKKERHLRSPQLVVRKVQRSEKFNATASSSKGGATHPGQDYFVLGVLDLNQHAHPRGRGEVILNRIVIDLYPVCAWNRGAFYLDVNRCCQFYEINASLLSNCDVKLYGHCLTFQNLLLFLATKKKAQWIR